MIELEILFQDDSQFLKLLSLERDWQPEEDKIYHHVRRAVHRLQTELLEFKREIHLYKKEFIYKGVELTEKVEQWIAILKCREEPSDQTDTSQFKEWLSTYKSKFPDMSQDVDVSMLSGVMTVKVKKESRVSKVVVPPLEKKPT